MVQEHASQVACQLEALDRANDNFGEPEVKEDFLARRRADFQDLPQRASVADGLNKSAAGISSLTPGFHPEDEVLPFEVRLLQRIYA